MDASTPPATPIEATPVTTEDKTVAIVSYLTLIGFIVAIVMHGNKKTQLGAFHLRQTLGLLLTGIVFWAMAWMLAFVPVIGWLTIPIVWIGIFVLWLMGFIAAASGQLKPVPVLGEKYQQWFAGTF